MSLRGYTLKNIDTNLVVKINTTGRFPGVFDLLSVQESSPSRANERWRFMPITGIADLYTIQSVSTSSYVGNDDGQGTIVKSNSVASAWSVVPDEKGRVVIKVPYSKLAWTFAAGGVDTPVTLSDFDPNNADRQTWEVIDIANSRARTISSDDPLSALD